MVWRWRALVMAPTTLVSVVAVVQDRLACRGSGSSGLLGTWTLVAPVTRGGAASPEGSLLLLNTRHFHILRILIHQRSTIHMQGKCNRFKEISFAAHTLLSLVSSDRKHTFLMIKIIAARPIPNALYCCLWPMIPWHLYDGSINPHQWAAQVLSP